MQWQIFIRESDTRYNLEIFSEKIKNCARGAALSTGTRLEIENYEYSFADLISNSKLSDIYTENLKLLGIEEIEEGKDAGSTDMGDVSYACPTIHPYFPISECELVGHTVEFAKASITEKVIQGMKEAIFAMVLTSLDIISDKNKLKEIKDEFYKIKSSKK